MEMKITASLFEAYLKCPTKCYLRSLGEIGTGNAYAEWIRNKNESYRNDAIMRLKDGAVQEKCVSRPPVSENLKSAKWLMAVDFVGQAQNMESGIDAAERIPSEKNGKSVQLIPVRYIFRNKLTKDDKLLLAFDAFVLSEQLGRKVEVGKFIHGDDHDTLNVKTSSLMNPVRKLTERMDTLLSGNALPELILNRHCSECEFQSRCRQKAIEKDDLSLLSRMNEKERKKYNSQGIFTVTQLSYTFRPRRRPKRLRDKREKYHHSLKALAIREKKIHIVGSPELKIEGTPVYFDVEGLPDRDFYYLIGIRIGNGDTAIQHSLWADNEKDEERIWVEFLAVLNGIENPVLIHYGSYETTFLKRMCKRYGKPPGDSPVFKTILSTINLLSIMYARIYFPILSNGLKDIAGHLGFRWSDSLASGVRSIVWRCEWEAAEDPSLKAALLTYNAQDCEALDLLTHKVVELHKSIQQADISPLRDVVNTDKLKREHPYGFKRNTFALPELESINKAAYWDYQRERVYVKSLYMQHTLKRSPKKTQALFPNKIIEWPRPHSCPKCNSNRIHSNVKFAKIMIDFRFMHHGIKRWVTRYLFQSYECQNCHAVFHPEDRCWTQGKYGSELIAYSLYQNIELRLSQENVDRSLNKLFSLHLPLGTTKRFKIASAKKYETAYKEIISRLCHGTGLLHVDETKVSVKGQDGFVWIYANMVEVAYVYTGTREGDFLHSILKDFKGILVSDFYAAYDGINCPQQKCLIHLIRDLNDAVLKHPYDLELKGIVSAFADLVKPMVETVDRHGLKRYFLRKHLISVDRFYKRLPKSDFQSEAATKFKERFEKNRDKLFTFLHHDGVPWNNNNAEHAVKAFAMLRHVIGGVTSEKGLQEYLILLSICQTCKYRGLDFLDFLRSGEKDVDVFAQSRRRKSRVMPHYVGMADNRR